MNVDRLLAEAQGLRKRERLASVSQQEAEYRLCALVALLETRKKVKDLLLREKFLLERLSQVPEQN